MIILANFFITWFRGDEEETVDLFFPKERGEGSRGKFWLEILSGEIIIRNHHHLSHSIRILFWLLLKNGFKLKKLWQQSSSSSSSSSNPSSHHYFLSSTATPSPHHLNHPHHLQAASDQTMLDHHPFQVSFPLTLLSNDSHLMPHVMICSKHLFLGVVHEELLRDGVRKSERDQTWGELF